PLPPHGAAGVFSPRLRGTLAARGLRAPASRAARAAAGPPPPPPPGPGPPATGPTPAGGAAGRPRHSRPVAAVGARRTERAAVEMIGWLGPVSLAPLSSAQRR